jgi:hypothetical protein
MNVVHEFFRRYLSLSICTQIGFDQSKAIAEHASEIGYDHFKAIADHISEADYDKLFHGPINEIDPSVDIVHGFVNYIRSKNSDKVHSVNFVNPTISTFESIPTPYIVLSVTDIERLLDLLREKRIKYLSQKIGRRKARTELKWLPHVLLVLDEAQHLLGVREAGKDIAYIEFDDDQSKPSIDLFRLIRRTLGYSKFFWNYCWATTISTSTSITNFTPTIENDPSLRIRENIIILPPYLHSHSFDAMAASYKAMQVIFSNEDQPAPKDALTYIQSWGRIKDILSCGRPLFFTFVEVYVKSTSVGEWEGQINSLLKDWSDSTLAAFSLLYQMIQDKMNGGTTSSNLFDTKLESVDLIYALMSSAVGLYGCPSIVSKEDLVRKRMGWVVSADTKNNMIKVDFPSEGVLNIMCSQILLKGFHTFFKKEKFPESLVFFAKPATGKSFSSWQITEILSRLLFLFAHNAAPPKYDFGGTARREADYFSPRRLSDILCQLADPEVVVELFMKLGPQFEDCETYYGHFQQCKGAENPILFSKCMLYRGSARYLPKHHAGADFVLPLVLKDGSYGLVLVQVKGLSKNLLNDEEAAIEAMEKCNIFGVFGMGIDDKRLSDKTKKERMKQREKYKNFPTVSILINLTSCTHRLNNGAKIVSANEDSPPFLLIQSDCSDLSVLKDEVKWFFTSTLSKAGDAYDSRLPNYEAQFYEPPFNTNDSIPFNPVYCGVDQDNDKNLFGDSLAGMDRPDYKDI